MPKHSLTSVLCSPSRRSRVTVDGQIQSKDRWIEASGVSGMGGRWMLANLLNRRFVPHSLQRLHRL